MIENVEELTNPPVVGRHYLVPCVFGTGNVFDNQKIVGLFPVLRPSHNDYNYLSPITGPNHFHTDARFSEFPRHNSVNDTGQEIVFKEMVCLRVMPTIGALYSLFGKGFYEDHKNSNLKCLRCPHKGTRLASMEVRNGVIECPAHGLKFDCKTQDVIIDNYGDKFKPK